MAGNIIVPAYRCGNRRQQSPRCPASNLSPAFSCVDDEPGKLAVLRGILQEDYGLYFARSGEQALDAARKTRPSLILLDTQMPGMDGLTTCRCLKADPSTWDIPVVLVTDVTQTKRLPVLKGRAVVSLGCGGIGSGAEKTEAGWGEGLNLMTATPTGPESPLVL